MTICTTRRCHQEVGTGLLKVELHSVNGNDFDGSSSHIAMPSGQARSCRSCPQKHISSHAVDETTAVGVGSNGSHSSFSLGSNEPAESGPGRMWPRTIFGSVYLPMHTNSANSGAVVPRVAAREIIMKQAVTIDFPGLDESLLLERFRDHYLVYHYHYMNRHIFYYKYSILGVL